MVEKRSHQLYTNFIIEHTGTCPMQFTLSCVIKGIAFNNENIKNETIKTEVALLQKARVFIYDFMKKSSQPSWVTYTPPCNNSPKKETQ